MKKKIIQDCFKKYIVKRPKGMCQILFSLTELDNLCDEIKNDVFDERVLDILEIIEKIIAKSIRQTKLRNKGMNWEK